MPKPSSNKIEKKLIENGHSFIAGVDEVGRGPLAGPVVACAVIFPKKFFNISPSFRLFDSKKISDKKRRFLMEKIKKESLCFAISSVSQKIIDKINIHNASLLAMKKAILKLKIQPDVLLIDGIHHVFKTGADNKGIKIKEKTFIGGDEKIFSISAASIAAKVWRDDLMIEMDRRYPVYNFKKNKGYGTKEHFEKIKKHGISKIHRKTFVSNAGCPGSATYDTPRFVK